MIDFVPIWRRLSPPIVLSKNSSSSACEGIVISASRDRVARSVVWTICYMIAKIHPASSTHAKQSIVVTSYDVGSILSAASRDRGSVVRAHTSTAPGHEVRLDGSSGSREINIEILSGTAMSAVAIKSVPCNQRGA